MKLIYFYLGKCNGINFDFDINLSENKFLSISAKAIKIKLLDNNVIERFYGDNILNVSAIVGKNGTGKSTILNILGLKRLDLHHYYPDSEWMAIYEDDSDYYLEAMNIHSTIDINETFSDFIAYKMRLEGDELKYDSFIRYDDDIQDKHFVIHEPNLASDSPRRIKEYENDDQNYGLKRNYLKTNTANLYQYITDINDKHCSHLNKKFITIKISESKSIDKPKLKFYTDTARYSETGLLSHKTPKINNASQLFIIELLEKYVVYIICKIFNTDEIAIYEKIIEDNIYAGSLLDFDCVKQHFITLIELIKKTLNNNHDGIVKYLDDINWTEFFTILLTNDNLKFEVERNGFNNEHSCSIRLDNYDEEIYSFISRLSTWNSPIRIGLPKMSSGEYNINNKIAGINSAIKLSIDSNKEVNGFIIILDEYDCHLHPEWSRCFLKQCLDFLINMYGHYRFQLIVSTHSPYIISDLLKDNIIKVEHDDTNSRYSSSKAGLSFASNIYDIINDSFFLMQPIGEFAVNKINKIISNIDEFTIKNTYADYDRLYILIDLIDDSFIRHTLKNRLINKLDCNDMIKIDAIDREIASLELKKKNILPNKTSKND